MITLPPYVLIWPQKRCRHAFCRDCAKKAGGVCPRCHEAEQTFEEASMGSVHVCTHGGGRLAWLPKFNDHISPIILFLILPFSQVQQQGMWPQLPLPAWYGCSHCLQACWQDCPPFGYDWHCLTASANPTVLPSSSSTTTPCWTCRLVWSGKIWILDHYCATLHPCLVHSGVSNPSFLSHVSQTMHSPLMHDLPFPPGPVQLLHCQLLLLFQLHLQPSHQQGILLFLHHNTITT